MALEHNLDEAARLAFGAGAEIGVVHQGVHPVVIEGIDPVRQQLAPLILYLQKVQMAGLQRNQQDSAQVVIISSIGVDVEIEQGHADMVLSAGKQHGQSLDQSFADIRLADLDDVSVFEKVHSSQKVFTAWKRPVCKELFVKLNE